MADEGCYIAQCDLSGADGWTVAAYAAAQGDHTMLDDYRAGIKPAKVGVLMWQRGSSVNQLSRDELKKLCKEVDGESWQYFGFKRVQHGCYTEDHEVLTTAGWMSIKEFVLNTYPETHLLVYDNQTRDAWFSRPIEKQAIFYSGDLYTFKGSSIDLTVTADHMMPFTTNGNPKKITASQMAEYKSGTIPTACHYTGGHLNVRHARLIAAYQADGHYGVKKGTVTFHFKKLRKVQRLTNLLNKAGIAFTCNTHADGSYYIYIPRRFACDLIKWGKAASALMLGWSQESLLAYLDEHRYWDGSITQANVRCNLSAKDKDHILWLDTLLHLTLQNGSIQKPQMSGFGTLMHKLNYNRRTFASRSSMEVTKTRVEGQPVYCVTTSTGFIVVRRNGKIVMSGNSSYLMGKITMSDQILTDSWKLTGKPVFIPPATCEAMQKTCFFSRYWGIPRWHSWMEQEVRARGELVASNGFIRRFFGRKDDHATVKKALAHLPQVYTTYATMLALMRLWQDTENRQPDGSLRAEPLHTVHDSLLTQFVQADAGWASAKLRNWFNNPVRIAQETLVIPFEGAYGVDWKNLDAGVVG